jgi:DNA-binding beta-propeller fold protein YncE
LLGFGVTAAAGLGTAPETEKFIPSLSEFGNGAGQLDVPSGIATDPNTGDVYVTDQKRVSEFTPWGGFVRAFGWGVGDGVSQELQVCTVVCYEGVSGSGAGEFNEDEGIAIAQNGDIYVADFGNKRVQKFSSTGQFLLMFGGEVDKAEVHTREAQEAKLEPVTVTEQQEDVCSAASGQECGEGTEGSRQGQIEAFRIAIGPDGTVFVPSHERIVAFEQNGSYKAEIALPGKWPVGLAIDPNTSDFYITFQNPVANEFNLEENVYRLSPTGEPLGFLPAQEPKQLAADESGDIYVAQERVDNENQAIQRLSEFSPAGNVISEFDELNEATASVSVYALGVNPLGDLYVAHHSSPSSISFLTAYGPPPVVFEPPPAVPPTIEYEYALSSDQDSAVVQARINPHFWSDATAYVQYGTENCETGACASQPVAPGSKLTAKVVDESVVSQSVVLSGLRPDTTYHYRFVSQSSGGDPVYGPDQTFTTFPTTSPNHGCPNEAVRVGLSAALPDCRAYELVSPIDKNGGDILNLNTLLEVKNGLNESSLDGEAFTYSSDRAFSDPQGGPYVNQYMARRDPLSGWATEAISPPQHPEPGVTDPYFQTLYKFFSPDLSSAWLTPLADPPLAPGAVAGKYSLYRRTDDSGEFQTLATTGAGRQPELQGVSADGSRAVFRAGGALTSDASTQEGIEQVTSPTIRKVCVW